ncbi:hypothetical protein WA158_002800 [Blastocystis sp. Blastoise]
MDMFNKDDTSVPLLSSEYTDTGVYSTSSKQLNQLPTIFPNGSTSTASPKQEENPFDMELPPPIPYSSKPTVSTLTPPPPPPTVPKPVLVTSKPRASPVDQPIIPYGYDINGSLQIDISVPVRPIINKKILPKGIMNRREIINDISKEEALAALHTFVKTQKCWSQKLLSQMEVTNEEHYKSYVVTWENYTESRSYEWKVQPYDNQPLDDYKKGTVPDVWSIELPTTRDFYKRESHSKIPHTEFIMKCKICNGLGRCICPHCHGNPVQLCDLCKGSGGSISSVCKACNGVGKSVCTNCQNGYIDCEQCHNKQYMKYYLEKDCSEDVRVIDQSGMPYEYVKFIRGDLDFQETSSRLCNPAVFDDNYLNFACNEIYQTSVQKLEDSYDSVLSQRFSLYSMSVTKLVCVYNNAAFNVWVFGKDKKVYVPDYPVQSCGCCGIF